MCEKKLSDGIVMDFSNSYLVALILIDGMSACKREWGW